MPNNRLRRHRQVRGSSLLRAFRDALQFWWIRNSERAGLVIAVLVLAVLLMLVRPVGHPLPLTGVVTAVNVQDAKHQPPFNAWVDLGGGSQTIIGLEAGHGCVVGSRIALEKARFSVVGRFFGAHYAVAARGCHTPAALR